MENEILERLKRSEEKIDEVYKSVEKMRKYFLWTLIISVLVIVLPLIVLGFVLPSFINTLTAGYGSVLY